MRGISKGRRAGVHLTSWGNISLKDTLSCSTDTPTQSPAGGGNAIWAPSLLKQHLKGVVSPFCTKQGECSTETWRSGGCSSQNSMSKLPVSISHGKPHCSAFPLGTQLGFTPPSGPEGRQGSSKTGKDAKAVHWCFSPLQGWGRMMVLAAVCCAGRLSVDLDVFPLVVGKLPKRK